MPIELPEKLSRTDAEAILDRLPDRVRDALIGRSIEIEYPIQYLSVKKILGLLAYGIIRVLVPL